MITKLTNDEKLALVGILKWVVSADHDNSFAGIQEFFKQNKWGDFEKFYNEMDNKFEELNDLKEFLQTIMNKDAQVIIVKIAKDIMISDVVITNEEKGILDFLNEIWSV